MDSVMGCKGSRNAIIVLTERKTRYGITIQVEDHTSASVVKAINGLEKKLGRKLFYKIFKSITVDNGCEFQDFEGIEAGHRRKGRTIVFFCHPYSAYERGSNENMNRILRRFFPKGTNFDNVTKEQVEEAEKWMNDYPRKILGWRSAADLFREEVEKLQAA